MITEANNTLVSRSSSARSTPALQQTAPSFPRTFAPDASIVIIGIRGTGKSTLAIIASAAFRKRVIDTDISFQEVTGLTSSAYRKQFGAAEHNRRQADVLRTILTENDRNCVIVCSMSSTERGGQVLLREYAETHPVIHIIRDAKSIQEYLKIWDEKKIEDLMTVSGSVFRSCSNFEFYNLSETSPTAHWRDPDNSSDFSPELPGQRSPTPFLTLKRAERHFVKFITLTTAKANLPALEPAYPLSHVPVEMRQFTYAVSIPLSTLETNDLDIEGAEVGADAFELVIDHTALEGGSFPSQKGILRKPDHISRAFSMIRRNTIVPIIYHVPLAGNLGPEGERLYLEYVRHGLRLAPDFATIDLSLDEEIISHILDIRGPTKIIGHCTVTSHDAPGWDDPFWLVAYEKARKLGCNLVRFSRPARSLEDNFTVQSFKEKLQSTPGDHIPLIAYNSGHAGRLSACMNRSLTPVTHELIPAASDVENEPRPCITARAATEALYASFVFDPMRIYIIGGTAGYSLSPAMHNAAFKACGLPHTYQTHQTPSLNNIHALVNDPHFGGASISLPFKIEVIALTHSLSRHARAIGAVNTLVPVRNLQPDGSIPDELSLYRERNRAGPVKALYGENTDWIGIRACIRRGLSPANAVRPRTSGLVIGAGGMARAAVYAMMQLGIKYIAIFNRTVANAEKLVAHYKRQTATSSGTGDSTPGQEVPTIFHILQSRDEPWPEAFRHPTAIVSCIPTHKIGDSPAPDFTLPSEWLLSPTGGVVVELAYKTLSTPLLQQIRAEAHRGWVTMDGLDLLPEQGFAQYELFTGRRAPRRLMRMEVLRSYRDERGESDVGMLQSRLDKVDEQEP